MIHRCLAILGAALLAAPAAGSAPGERYRGADELAARLNRHVEAGWKAAGVTPAPAADDAEFARRVYLDIAGRIPSVTEVRAFLGDRRADRRTRLVEGLLASTRYPTHWVRVWRALLLPETSANFQVRFQQGAFESWLREALEKDKGYDVLVRELLTAPLQPGGRGAFALGGQAANPSVYFSAKEFKAEEIASAVARVFLGVNVGCAQCHNHPFAEWKREQFWQFAAFFAGIKVRRQGDFTFMEREVADARELTIPGTEKVVQARYLDGKEPQFKFKASTRQTLADWVTRKDNPYFARALVNRMWAHFLGTGLIEPVDEMVGAEVKSSHPALLDDLARAFVEHDFDLKFLIRAITATGAYQLTSRRTHPGQDDPRQFARMSLRGLTAEQLFDSLVQATGHRETGPSSPYIVNFGNGRRARDEFVNKFASASEKPTDVQTSILQALTLMNGRVISEATNLGSSETLAAVADAPFMTTASRIETLVLATLSRLPTDKERARLAAFVDGGGSAGGKPATAKERKKRYDDALADLFWALLNSGEFYLNH
jgi:hypothetical protein